MNESSQIDLKKLNNQEVEALSVQLGDQVRTIIDKACAKANKVLKGYGLQIKVQTLIEPVQISKEN